LTSPAARVKIAVLSFQIARTSMLKRDPAIQSSTLPLRAVLRTFAVMDMLAFIAVLMPLKWIENGHHWAGLGTFPEAPVAAYLARSASLMYGLHGVFLFLLSTDTLRYEKLIRWIAGITVFHGALMLAIDLVEAMPLWWTLVEGPAFSLTGVVILIAQHHAQGRTSPPSYEAAD